MSHSWGSRYRDEKDVFVRSCKKCGFKKYWVKSVPTFERDGKIYSRKAPKCDRSIYPVEEPIIIKDSSDHYSLWEEFKKGSGYARIQKLLLSQGNQQPYIDNIMRIPFDFAYDKLNLTTLTRDKIDTK